MEPLRGWVKAFDPPTLLLAIKKARSMDVTTTQNKFGSKGSRSTSFKDNRNFRKGIEKSDFRNDCKPKPAAPPLDRETLNDLRQKKLCFYCKGSYDANHDCPLRPKGRANRVMWAYYEDSESDHEGQLARLKMTHRLLQDLTRWMQKVMNTLRRHFSRVFSRKGHSK